MTNIRLGTVADIDAAVEVYAAAEAARRGAPVGAEDRDRVRARIEDDRSFLVVADDDGRLVGMAAAMDARAEEGAGDVIPGLCHLGLVFVRPESWGEGMGRHIVDAVLGEAVTRGYSRIQLYTHEDNLRGQRLYASRGFRRTGFAKDDDRGNRIALWARSLEPDDPSPARLGSGDARDP